MKRVILTGTTGMVGKIVLQHCLASPDIAQIISLTRKPSGIKHPKLTEILHQDFGDFSGYKGMAENYLISKGFQQLSIFRPAYIYPVTPRKEPNIMYRITRKLYPLFKAVYPAGVITSEQLGEAIFQAGLSGAEKMVLENQDIKKILSA